MTDWRLPLTSTPTDGKQTQRELMLFGMRGRTSRLTRPSRWSRTTEEVENDPGTSRQGQPNLAALLPGRSEDGRWLARRLPVTALGHGGAHEGTPPRKAQFIRRAGPRTAGVERGRRLMERSRRIVELVEV